MDFKQRYRAVDTRDARFDGVFFTAVRSTGIYCRPSCPARTPKPENVTFYETSAAAHEAGYRACKRCLPEATPGTPAWNLRSDVAARAMRLINDGLVDDGGVSALADRLGYSSRQLGRILTSELGAGPLALARAARAQTARTLLVSTRMPMSEVAFAAGFNSIRQFNDTVHEVFDRTPGQLRSSSRSAAASAMVFASTESGGLPEGVTGGLDLRLPLRPPYDPGIFAFLAARSVPGIEISTVHQDGSRSYERALRLTHGVAHFTVTFSPRVSGALQLQVHEVALKDLHSLITRVRRLLDLDADPVGIDQALSADPRLARLVQAAPGMRLPGALDPAELLIRAMVGQQITVAAATTALGLLAECAEPFNPLISTRTAAEEPTGTTTPEDEAVGRRITRLFPSSQAIAEHGPDLIKGPARRVDSIVNAANLMASGRLRLGIDDTSESLAEKLLPLPGIGPWTVGYVSMRLLGSPDVLLGGDAAIRNGLKALESDVAGSVDPARLGQPDPDFTDVSPWRSYATMHLWRLAASVPAARSSRKAASHG